MPPDFFGGGSLRCFFELGGVWEKPDESAADSSSVSGFGRFAGAFAFSFVCVSFFAAGFAAALGAGFDFYKNIQSVIIELGCSKM